MPPKAKITKDMIIEIAFEVVKTEGVEHLNTRSISQRLNCSTQPVLYHFSTIEEIKKETYKKADEYHAEYITKIHGDDTTPILEIGLRYIKFAYEESGLFRFLFQSNKFDNNSIIDLIDAGGMDNILSFLEHETGTSCLQTKDIFTMIFLTAHGFASFLANNSMEYDETKITKILSQVLQGQLSLLKGEKE